MKDVEQKIEKALEEGGRAHIHGAPGAGKRWIIARVVPKYLRFEVPPLAGRTIAQDLSAAFATFAERLGVANPSDDTFAGDPGEAFWAEAKRILESSAAPGLSIRLADDILFAPDFLRSFRDGLVVKSHPTLRIITSSRLSPAAVAAYLAAEPANIEPAEHVIGLIEFDPDADELSEEMQELAKVIGGGRGAERAAEALVTATDGHRRLCWQIARCIAEKRKKPSPESAATLATEALDRLAEDSLEFARHLCPAVFAAVDSNYDDAGETWGQHRYAGFVRDATDAFARHEVPSAGMEGLGLFVSTRSGLVRRGGVGGNAVRSALTPAVRRRIATDANFLALREEQTSQSKDPLLENILVSVEEELCKSAWGRAAKATLLREQTQVVVKGFSYRLTLRHEVPDASGENRLKQIDEIAVFSGLNNADETSRALYEREVQLLRRLATTGESALPSYRRGGKLKGGDATNFVWLQSRRIGPRLDTPRMDEIREVGDGAFVAREAGRLVEALAALHEHLILHRGIMPRNVAVERLDEADFRLVLTGFEFSALARDALRIQDKADATRSSLLFQAREWQIRSLDECVFIAPEQQNQIHENGGYWTMRGDDSSEVKTDVFALAMLLAQLLFGPPKSDFLKSYAAKMRRTDSVRHVEDAFEEFLNDYRQWIEELPEGPLTGYRAAVLLGLRASRDTRPDIIAFGRAISDARTAVAKRRRETETGVYLLTYERHLMSEMLRKNVREARDWPQDERLDAKVKEWVEARLSSAERIEYAPGGPPAHVRGTSGRANLARYAIECDRVTIFAALLYRGSVNNTESRVLRVAFVVECKHLPGRRSLADGDVRFPIDQWELIDDADPRRNDSARIGDKVFDWSKLFTEFDTFAPVVGEALHAQEVWRFQSELALTTAQSKEMPVTVWTQDSDLELGIDPVTFAEQHQNNAFFPLLREGLSAEEFFDLSISRWLDEQEAISDDEVYFVGTNGARSQLNLLGLPQAGRVSASVVSGPRPHGAGFLRFHSSQQARWTEVREQDAIRRYLAEPDKFRDLARPEPTFQVDPPLPESLPPSVGGRTSEIVGNMVNADSFFALQGPPGTGKTTAIAWLVRQELKRDESQRILLTSQSHAGVDNLLGTVTHVLKSGDDLRDDLSENSRVLRILPSINPDRVPRWIQEDYAVDGVLKKVRMRMKKRAEKPTDLELEQEAQEQLLYAQSRGYQEIKARIERTASLVFATTASASPLNKGLAFSPNRDRFDIAVIDEAAKAGGIDIVSPMSLAEKSVLVGDHRQLPAFNESGVLQRLDAARRMEREPRFAPLRIEPEKTAAWLNPFRRLFTWRENTTEEPSPLVIDSLDTQFRSRPEIGDMISDVFYDGKIKTAERPSWPDPPIDFARVWPELADRPRPALAWIDTSCIDGAKYRERSGTSKSNAGEAELLRELVSQTDFDFKTFKDSEEKAGRKVDPNEFALFLAPYGAQLQHLQNELSEFGERLGVKDVKERIKTVDSSQGSEAHVVFIDLVRSQRGIDVPHYDAHPRDWNATINGGYGFLSDPERINVMMSRAKTSLVLIGDHSHFARLPSLIDGWARNQPSAADREEIEQRHGFWQNILNAFDPAAGGVGLRLDARALQKESL